MNFTTATEEVFYLRSKLVERDQALHRYEYIITNLEQELQKKDAEISRLSKKSRSKNLQQK